MGLFANLFRKNKNRNNSLPDEYKSVQKFNNEFNLLLSIDKYIARSDYSSLITKYRDTYLFYENNRKADTLAYYCKTNNLNIEEINIFLQYYSDIVDLRKGSLKIKQHNEEYISLHLNIEKEYLDNILQEVDAKIKLDDEQRRVILSDEDYTLVIAGAGAGKTTTVAAKVRYLVEKKYIDPKQILVISFTNKAVGELRERINEQLAIPCPITTFHKTGNAILHKQDDNKKQIVSDGFLFNAVNNYLKGNILDQPELVDKLIMFFGSYFDAPYDGDDINLFFNYVSKADFSTLKSNVNEYNDQIIDRRTNKVITITNEIKGEKLSILKCDSCKDGYLIVKKTSKNDYMLGCTNYRADGTGCNRVMFSNEYFANGIKPVFGPTMSFENDLSADKPAYRKDEKIEPPKMIPLKATPKEVERKKVEVHTTDRKVKYIEQDGFQVIVDNEGQLLTDMELLAKLRALRSKIMRENNRPAYTIISNNGLVSLATYRPTTKEEFVALYGLGETTYSEYGAIFMKMIKDYDKR